MKQTLVSERRRAPRHSVEPITWVVWRDASGETQRVRGQCLDVSDGGIRVRISRAVEIGTEVEVGVPIRQITRRGTVRHCTSADGWHNLGVEYTTEPSDRS